MRGLAALLVASSVLTLGAVGGDVDGGHVTVEWDGSRYADAVHDAEVETFDGCLPPSIALTVTVGSCSGSGSGGGVGTLHNAVLGVDVTRTVTVHPLAGATGQDPALEVAVDVHVAGVLEVVVSTSPAGDVTPRLAPGTATPGPAAADDESVTWTGPVTEGTTETFTVEFDPGRAEPGVVPAVRVTLVPGDERGLRHIDGTIDLVGTVVSRTVVMAQRVPPEGATPATAAGTARAAATLGGQAVVGAGAARIMATGDYRPGIDPEGWSTGSLDFEELLSDKPLGWAGVTTSYAATSENLWWDPFVSWDGSVDWTIGAVEHENGHGMEDGDGQVIPFVFAVGTEATFRDGEPSGNGGGIHLVWDGVKAGAGGQAEGTTDDSLPVMPILFGSDEIYDTSMAGYVLAVDAVGGDLVNDGATSPSPSSVTLRPPPGWWIWAVFESRFDRGIDAFDVDGFFTDDGGFELTVSLKEGQWWLETRFVDGLADWRHIINVHVMMMPAEPLIASPLVASHTATVRHGDEQLLTVHTAGGEPQQHHLGPGQRTVTVAYPPTAHR